MSMKQMSGRRWAMGGVWCALCGAAVLMVAATREGAEARKEAGSATQPVTPVFAKTEPAKNATGLTLLADSGKVMGWISGAKDFAGREVKVEVGGLTQSVVVGAGNLFTWRYDKVAKATEAKFSIADMVRTTRLMPPETLEPSAFFVVDRTVYRPQQPVLFAGFLRTLDERGAFVPAARKDVEVQITSEAKKTVAAKLKLTSDENGRIAGQYRFSEGDALDTYTLAIPGYKGSAKVSLAEFRKSKIKLKIAGKVEDGALKLNFEAVDFLDKPVEGSKVHFTAQVVQNAQREHKTALKSEEFVYYERQTWGLPDVEEVSEDEQLLCEADNAYLPMLGIGRSMVVAQVQGDVQMVEKGKAQHTMPLQSEWFAGRHSVVVQGVLLDQNGREQRASASIPLDGRTGGLNLALAKRCFMAGEPIVVSARSDKAPASASLVAMKLKAPANPYAYGYGGPWGDYYMGNGWNGPIYSQLSSSGFAYRSSSLRAYRAALWNPVAASNPIERVLATATVFKGGSAELKLTEPGAYKLVAIAQLPEGGSVQEEIGCAVRDPQTVSPLILQLDKSELAAGERLTGQIHSRLSGAKVLLSVRDSTGIRLCEPLQLDGSALAIDRELPRDLRYGCTVQVSHVDNAGMLQVASQFVRVVPQDRIINITTTTKDEVLPGENVKIDIQVNRQEPVDLVVSVYDQSLLGIAPDKSVDIRNFYLADERARWRSDRDVLARRLDGMTLAGAIETAQGMLQRFAKENQAQTVEYAFLNEAVSNYNNSGYLYARDVVALLRTAGVNVHLLNYPGGGTSWHTQLNKDTKKDMTLLDLVEATAAQQEFKLQYRFWNDTLVMREWHPQWAAAGYFNGQQGQMFDGSGLARNFAVSGNGSYSVSGQAFISHMPTGGGEPVQLLDVDPSQGNVYLRRDFSDAAYWNAQVRTDDRGKASVEFKLPDSLTNWQVVVTAVSKDMHVGNFKSKFRSFKPIMVWPMLPRVFTAGDKVDIFASVHNQSDKPQTIKTSIKVQNGEVLSPLTKTIVVGAKENAPVYWTFRAGDPDYTQILMSVECEAGSDASLKRLPVVASSVQQVVTSSGFCKETASITMPDGIDPKTASLEISLVPSLAADMVDTLNYLVDYPHGCVEQTMSRFLPCVKVAQILERQDIKHDDLKAKLPGYVDAGIKRLLQLQQPDGGWGWQGTGTTHEMMTPYALYGLLEAEKADYRIGSEDAIKKGLARLRVFIDNMTEAQTADRIYCMYVYTHREPMQDAWWGFISAQLAKKNLSHYAMALALEMAVDNGHQQGLAGELAKALRGSAVKAGDGVCWTTANFSRWGNDPNEITAAAFKALAAYDINDPLIPGILSFLAENKRGNHWNSTKDTAMILYATCDYLARQDRAAREKEGKNITVTVNDGRSAVEQLEPGISKKIVIAGEQLHAGQNIVRFADASRGIMYRMVLRYKQGGASIPPAANGIEVARHFYLLKENGQRDHEIKAGEVIARGSYIESEIIARNVANQEMRYVLVANPKPSTCEIQPVEDTRFNQNGTGHNLREDKTVGVFYHHEQTAAQITDRCVMHAELAGEFLVPPAEVEMMYRTQTRGHSGTFGFAVK